MHIIYGFLSLIEILIDQIFFISDLVVVYSLFKKFFKLGSIRKASHFVDSAWFIHKEASRHVIRLYETKVYYEKVT